MVVEGLHGTTISYLPYGSPPEEVLDRIPAESHTGSTAKGVRWHRWDVEDRRDARWHETVHGPARQGGERPSGHRPRHSPRERILGPGEDPGTTLHARVTAQEKIEIVMDPPLPGMLDRPPRPAKEPILGRSQWVRIGWVGALEASVVLSVFVAKLNAADVTEARGFAFSTLVFCEVFRAFAARSRRLVHWQVGAFTNIPLLAVVALCAVVQASLGHVPFARDFFRMRAMSAPGTGLCMALGLIPVTVLEVGKLLRRESVAEPAWPPPGALSGDRKRR
jgi:Cation transporting ATPase, C-terminus